MTMALILVDIQNDFLPGGALAVPNGDEVIPVANEMTPCFNLVVATQDWHPANHGSFAAVHPGHQPGEVINLHGLEQVLWPVHCVQESAGAEFAEDLNLPDSAHIFQKGTDETIDSYSGFFDNGHRRATGLGEFLESRKVTDVYILGLATDYCVKFTALDAKQLGFETHLILPGCRGVELKEGDVEAALSELKEAGIVVHDNVPPMT